MIPHPNKSTEVRIVFTKYFYLCNCALKLVLFVTYTSEFLFGNVGGKRFCKVYSSGSSQNFDSFLSSIFSSLKNQNSNYQHEISQSNITRLLPETLKNLYYLIELLDLDENCKSDEFADLELVISVIVEKNVVFHFLKLSIN